jgi:phosphatidylserine/phosphatidylglycerophosphate/cardiolipin synthase-like enzyme
VRHLAVLSLAAWVACAAPDPASPDAEDPADDGETGTPEDGEPEPLPTPTGEAVELVPGCTARVTVAGFPTWLHFTRPDRPCTPTMNAGEDFHAIAELIRLIDSVPAGGRIDGHIYSITIDSVGKALLEAQTRGVDVRISTDGQVGRSADAAKTLYLDKLNGIVYCMSATNDACISTADKAISHSKLFVFSHATAPDKAESDNVVWLGSANQTVGSGMALYNNTVTLYGDTALYTLMRDYLDDLRLRRRATDYYKADIGRGYLLSASANVFVSPEVETDLVENRLDDVTPDSTCRVRVMQASVRDTRIDVVNRLVALKRGGCEVSVVASTVEPDALAALKAGKIPVRQMPIHDKVFLVYGKYNAGYQYRVYTGSHNLSGGSAHRFDEIFVRLAPESGATHPVYDEYVTHYADAYDVGTPL